MSPGTTFLRRWGRVRPRGPSLVLGAAMAIVFGFAMWAVPALAETGTPIIDLTNAGADIKAPSGVRFIQGGTGAGTGQFDPFLSISPGGKATAEQGYNSLKGAPGIPQFDESYGGPSGGHTHPVKASAIPPILIGSTLYREFSLDANETGSEDFISIDQIKIFLDDDNNLAGYNGTTFTANNTGTSPTLLYDMDAGGDTTVLMATQSLTPGSGVSDITVLVPDTMFPANCFYGSTTCTQWLYFFTQSGAYVETAGNPVGPAGVQKWDVSAGFEEWRTRLLPVVNVTKTVIESRTLTYDWTIAKEVSTVSADGPWVEAGAVDLFNGDSKTIWWRITPTRLTPVVSNLSVSGIITVTNPTGPGQPIESPIDAVILGVTDELKLPGPALTAAPVGNCQVDGSPQSIPFTLQPGETLTCNYNATPADAIDGTNQAVVTLDNGTAPDLVYKSALMPVEWATAITGEVDENATFTDDHALPAPNPRTAVSGTSVVYSQVLTCGSTENIENTATLTEGDSSATRTDKASVQKNCYALEVTKDATGAFKRRFDWTLVKQVSTTSATDGFQDAITVDLVNGQVQQYWWKITWTKSAGEDFDHEVSGTITITNAAPIDATNVSVTDVVSGLGVGDVAEVDCSDADGLQNTGLTVPAAGQLSCSYTEDLPDGTQRTNTAKAKIGTLTPEYTGTADVIFPVDPAELIDESANIADPDVSELVNTGVTSGGSDVQEKSFTCGPGQTRSNSATLTASDGESDANDTASASITFTCGGLTVSKTVNTSLERRWQWEIDKTIVGGTNDVLNLLLSDGQVYTVDYSVVVRLQTVPSVDSNWKVFGGITITNTALVAITGVNVTDVLTGALSADVDCNVAVEGLQNTNLTVPAKDGATNGVLNCTYTRSLPDGSSRDNVAAATYTPTGGAQQSSSDTKAVSFGSATVTKINECVDVYDWFDANNNSIKDTDEEIKLGVVCVTPADVAGSFAPPKTFTYSKTFGKATGVDVPLVCGDNTRNNTARFIVVEDANDAPTANGASGSDQARVNANVTCVTGCTLTQGYWKTHSDRGPAPYDDTWLALGTLQEDTPFFLSGQTWYQVFWTAPRGNAYYNLAHQYMAAKLNDYNNTTPLPAAVLAAITQAETLFNAYTDEQIGALSGNNATRQQFISLAGTLANFNEGNVTGWPHCSEDRLSARSN